VNVKIFDYSIREDGRAEDDADVMILSTATGRWIGVLAQYPQERQQPCRLGNACSTQQELEQLGSLLDFDR
jgi:hypothetical protein